MIFSSDINNKYNKRFNRLILFLSLFTIKSCRNFFDKTLANFKKDSTSVVKSGGNWTSSRSHIEFLPTNEDEKTEFAEMEFLSNCVVANPSIKLLDREDGGLIKLERYKNYFDKEIDKQYPRLAQIPAEIVNKKFKKHGSLDFNLIRAKIEEELLRNNIEAPDAKASIASGKDLYKPIFSPRALSIYELNQIAISTFMTAIEEGNLKILRYCLLNNFNLATSIKDIEGETIWHKFARCKSNREEVARIFSGKIIYYKDSEDDKPLTTNTLLGLPKGFFSSGRSFIYDDKDFDGDNSPLFLAVKIGNLRALSIFVSKAKKVIPAKLLDNTYDGCREILKLAIDKQKDLKDCQDVYKLMKTTQPCIYKIFEGFKETGYLDEQGDIKFLTADDEFVRNDLGYTLLEIIIERASYLSSKNQIASGESRINGEKKAGLEPLCLILKSLKIVCEKFGFVHDQYKIHIEKHLKLSIDTKMSGKFNSLINNDTFGIINSANAPKELKINSIKLLHEFGATKEHVEIYGNAISNSRDDHSKVLRYGGGGVLFQGDELIMKDEEGDDSDLDRGLTGQGE